MCCACPGRLGPQSRAAKLRPAPAAEFENEMQMTERRLGIVQGLYVTHIAGAPMFAAEVVEAVKARGLVGDRYFLGTGYYSSKQGWGANVTLIESEAIAAINAGHNASFTSAIMRRNIVTTDIKIESLIGCEFRCGNAVLHGTKPFPPCAHLAYLIGDPAILRYLAHCGGIGAEVVAGGTIKLNDRISPI
jgi:MOSC domain-containing protein YiiM